MPDVSVIVPARDAQRSLGRTLDALDAQQFHGSFEVLVVDDGSQDATAQLAEARGVRVLRHERCLGPGAARNGGAAAAAGGALAFTDADCEPAPGWLAAAWEALDNADIVLGPVAPAHPPGPLDRTVWVAACSGLFETANLVVRREVFERAGGFPAGLAGLESAHNFGEDALFGWTAVRGGARVVFEPRALVLHEVMPRGARAFIAERRRLGLFPLLVREIPELRGSFLQGRCFLNRRTARFDLAAAGLLGALVLQRRWPLLALLPYASAVRDDARMSGRRAAAVRIAADCVGAAALARGSAAYRSLVI